MERIDELLKQHFEIYHNGVCKIELEKSARDVESEKRKWLNACVAKFKSEAASNVVFDVVG